MEFLNRTYPLENPATPLLFDQLSLWSSNFGRLLLDNIPLKKDMVVLDVGCGTGFPLLELARLLGPESQLTGIDLWQAGLDRARWKADHQALKKCRFYRRRRR